MGYGASVLIHLGIVGATLLVSAWAPLRVPVLMAELVVLDTPDPAPVAPAAPPTPARDRRPLTPPRPIATPMPPEPPARSEPTPEPATPSFPEPPAVPVLPSPPTAAAPSPIVSPPPPSSAPPGSFASVAPEAEPGAFAVSAPTTARPTDSPSPATSSPAVAAIPPDGITHRAIPRGGYQHRPAYPSSARRLGVQGTTLLSVLVADDGRVAEVVVKQSAGHPDLDQAAADAVRRWRFEPARRGSEAVAMWVLLPVEFRLR
jgi:periplasmic protein TonB